jgi:hypothetical protein
MATNKTVTINVYSNGDFNYNFALLGVQGGDTVTWNGGPDTGLFTITFQNDMTPLTSGEFEISNGSAGGTFSRIIQDGLPANKVYKYAVTATHIPTGRSWSDGACPELIIR